MHITPSRFRRARTSIVGPFSAIVALAVLPGCGAIIDAAVDEAGEQVAEEVIGAEIEQEDGSFVIRSEDGTVSISSGDDGVTIEAEDADGNETGVMQASDQGVTIETETETGTESAIIRTDTDVPSDLGVPIAPGGEVEVANTYEDSSVRVGQVTVRYGTGEIDRVADFYFDHFDGDSTIETFDLDSSEGRVVTFTNGEEVLVTLQENAPGVLLFIQAHMDR